MGDSGTTETLRNHLHVSTHKWPRKVEFIQNFSAGNVMLTATHTHSAPGGFMQYALFYISTGFIPDSFNALVNGITKVRLQQYKCCTIWYSERFGIPLYASAVHSSRPRDSATGPNLFLGRASEGSGHQPESDGLQEKSDR